MIAGIKAKNNETISLGYLCLKKKKQQSYVMAKRGTVKQHVWVRGIKGGIIFEKETNSELFFETALTKYSVLLSCMIETFFGL